MGDVYMLCKSYIKIGLVENYSKIECTHLLLSQSFCGVKFCNLVGLFCVLGGKQDCIEII